MFTIWWRAVMRNKRNCWLAALVVVLAGCSDVYQEIEDVPVGIQEEDDPWIYKDLLDHFQLGSGGPLTLSAGFEETRTSIEMNEEGTFASTVWRVGDTFTMYAGNGTGSYGWAPFSTTQAGASVDFTTKYSLSYPAPYYVVYPSIKHFGYDNEKVLLGVNIPSSQTAVPGGIKDGVAVSFALSQNISDYLHFNSLVSLVRFRLSGAIASQIKRVTIKGAGNVAGDAILVVEKDGSFSLTQDRTFGGDVHSNAVSLSGDFVVGQDYYIALIPGTQPSFQMIFADADGRSITKIASQFTFPRAQISDFGTIDLGDEFTDGFVDPTPIPYMTASAGAPKPVTIAVIPEGFTEDEMSTYEMLAKSGIDALMNTEPFRSYKEYFNVWIMRVASQESGASVTDGNGNVTTAVNSYFGAKWGNDSYSDMVADENLVYSYVTEHCPDIINGKHTIQEVPILMIINDKRYGGICHSYSDGRAYCMVPYTYEGGAMTWSFPSIMPKSDEPLPGGASLQDYYVQTPQTFMDEIGGKNFGDWRNTLVHEFGGHCFSRLGDEYWENSRLVNVSGAVEGHNWPVPYSLNVASDSQNVLWKTDLLDRKTGLVSVNPLYERIGIYQGGGTYIFGRWRSEKISCMIDNRFYFSTWQRMLIVKRIMNLCGGTFDIDSFWAKDDPTDPVRDQISSSVMGNEHPLQLREMPMLPPPVLHEN